MKFGLNQAGFPAEDFETSCAVAAAAGYDGVEPNYVEDGLLDSESGRRTASRIVDDHALDVPAVSTTAHWEYPLSSSDEATRTRGIEVGMTMVDAARRLDAEQVLVVPGVVEPGMDYDAAYERAVESVRELASYGDREGVTVAVENVQNDFLYSPGEFETFLGRVEDAGPVSVYFDVANGLRWGLPDRWIRALGDRIERVHVKDWVTDAHRVTYPLQGDVDWEHVRAALDDVDYDGWLTAEVPPYESFPERMPPDVLKTMQFLFDPLAEP